MKAIITNTDVLAVYFNEYFEVLYRYAYTILRDSDDAKDADLARLRISSVFDNKRLEYVLDVIISTLNLNYTYLNSDEISIEAE
ncbi:hypothetical protein [Chitinophaga sp. LS1]|uniref:hypothetical protein n=1 Tax=Chitinophaga sp. LS1 TaxID=3051176 RepID=UPI002AABD505|nr:hypothetical protein [Chitinophaga sp. LS1]WPV66456.1 hypothetical protein QQL36_32175 [Chitinophaga sp. LS1]